MAIEREIKLALTEPESARIAELLAPPSRVIHQRNHYLDTPHGALRSRGYGLRLREESPGSISVTLKGPASTQGALTERSEDEIVIERPEAERILSGQATFASLRLPSPPGIAAACAADPLSCWGVTENERRTFRLRVEASSGGGHGLDVELDRTTYPDGSIDCELEAEWPDPEAPFPEGELRALLARAGAQWRPQEQSKLARLRHRGRSMLPNSGWRGSAGPG